MVERAVAFEGVDEVEALSIGDLEDFAFDLVAVWSMAVAKVGQVGHDQFAQLFGLGSAYKGSARPDHDVMVRSPALEGAVNEYF